MNSTNNRSYPESAVEQLRSVLRKAWGLSIALYMRETPEFIEARRKEFISAYKEIPGEGPFGTADDYFDAVVKGN